MMQRIESIRLSRLLPAVFAGEKLKPSQVWLTELEFQRGNRYLVSAESGAGKSSLCAFIYGNRTDYQGTIFFNDADIRKYNINEWQELRRRHLAYLPQDLMLFPELTAIENIRLKNSLTEGVSEDRIAGWMEELGIDFRRDYPAGKMSVGQQQRVAIIRALCQPFDFLLLDEPVSHLDEENNRKAAKIIEARAEELGASIISTSVGNPLLLDNAIRINL